jgi:hypothetical protein
MIEAHIYYFSQIIQTNYLHLMSRGHVQLSNPLEMTK